jgi:hypothetical protein
MMLHEGMHLLEKTKAWNSLENNLHQDEFGGAAEDMLMNGGIAQ